MKRSIHSHSFKRQRGLSLVELMIGVALGLFIVAGATILAVSQLASNRQMLVATQVQQDLRAAADIITRELRRAGYRPQAEKLIWNAQSPTTEPAPNLRAGLRVPPDAHAGDIVSYDYERIYGSTTKDFGYRLGNGTIKQRIGSPTSVIQDLTDRSTLEVTAFTVEIEPVAEEQLACPRLCADGTQACWPTVKVVDAKIKITGQPARAASASESRTVESRVRLRNDAVTFDDITKPVCPA